MCLGVKAVLVKSFARIHHANLVNFGILPLVFARPSDYERLRRGDELRMVDVRETLRRGRPFAIVNTSQGYEIQAKYSLSDRQVQILLAGGLLNLIKANQGRDVT